MNQLPTNFIDEEVERNALSILFSGTPHAEQLALALKSEYFSRSLYQKAFLSAVELLEEGMPADASQVVFQMKRQGRISEIRDAIELMEQDTTNQTALFKADKWKHYADTLKQLYVFRQCKKAVEQYNHQISEADPYTASLSLIEIVEEINQSKDITDVQAIGTLAYEASERIRKTLTGELVPTYTPTGVRSLDGLISGFYPKQYISIAARPAQGKSALALQIALNMAKFKQPTAYVTLEMSKEEQADRCLANLSGVPIKRIRNPKYLHGDDLSKVQQAAAQLSGLPLYFVDEPAMTVSNIAAKVKEMKKTLGIKGIFVDMIQLVKAEKHDAVKGKTEQITNISKSLKALAKKEDIWICNIVAMNRDADKQNRRPKVSDIRESGQIESDSDLVVMIYRPNYDPEQPPREDEPEDIDVIVGKHRNGAQGTIQMTAHFHINKFEAANRSVVVSQPSWKKDTNKDSPF
jgi:replicative DNA helicase